MNLYEECKGASTIAISGHVRPDGDCVGSCMSMALYLRKLMPEATVDVYLDQISDVFYCIKDADGILHEAKNDITYDVFICVDCEPGRMSFGHDLYDNARKTINIDHHLTNVPGKGDVNYVNPDSGSAAELVYEVLDHDKMDADIALPIYIGIIHDTGVLQYSNVSPSTLHKVAELIEYGFEFAPVIQKTFYEKTFVQDKLLGRVLVDCELIMGGRGVVGVISKEVMDSYGADSRDLEGIVNQLRNIRGVDCAIFMYEMEPLVYKVSLRTSKYVDASAVTAVYGGGGHAKAAGVTMNGTPEEVVKLLSVEIEKQFALNE